MSLVDLCNLQTEGRNPNSTKIDEVSTLDLCRIINNEDAAVAGVVEKCISVIAPAIDALTERVRQGGRVIYVGAGTSGRLGVVDASEIPPTYSVPREKFVALIAGGDQALRNAQEGAEDDLDAAVADLKALTLNGGFDSLIGIAASGRTPYVLSCLSYAKSLGCLTIGVACSAPSAMSASKDVDWMVNAVTGAEVITGSTRMKAGTATKLILNMLSTGVMIKIGKTYGNIMVDLKATNLKLQQRSRNILRGICISQCPKTDEELDVLLRECGGSVKLALVTLSLQTTVAEATKILNESGGVLTNVLNSTQPAQPAQNDMNTMRSHHEYVLCVDAGGSKCAAVIMGKSGETGQGEAGECNITDIGVDGAVSSISLAIRGAVESCSSLKGTMSISSVPFRSIWIAIAGCDRPGMAERIKASLSKLFIPSIGDYLLVTDDIELLATAVANKYRTDSATVLVAGTGSVAMSYKRGSGSRFVRIGRSGGWGHILGDDGSGFDIGRKGIRLALAEIDNFNLQNPSTRQEIWKTRSIDPLCQKILNHFGCTTSTRPNDQALELLSPILSPDSSSKESHHSQKHRIASAAKVIIEASPVNQNAQTIVEDGAASLVGLLRPFLANRQVEPSSSVLVLAGGLMQSEIYQQITRDKLTISGTTFKQIEVVDQPAFIGARWLQEWSWESLGRVNSSKPQRR